MIERIRRLVKKSNNIVFFGGAGVSTESGIPDFRGTGGMYTEEREDGLDPAAMLSRRMLIAHPESFFEFYRSSMLYPGAEPNDAHYALARLEAEGKLSAVITQNIDGLHARAGSRNVLELHGTTSRAYCLRCGKLYPGEYVNASVGVPRCTVCGDIVRPDVTLYGEALPSGVFARAEEAVAEADMLIVGGTSLTVYPAASLVDFFEGEHLVIINYSPTPYDGYAEYVLRESVGEVLRAITE